jgi:hypothetical protein
MTGALVHVSLVLPSPEPSHARIGVGAAAIKMFSGRGNVWPAEQGKYWVGTKADEMAKAEEIGKSRSKGEDQASRAPSTNKRASLPRAGK